MRKLALSLIIFVALLFIAAPVYSRIAYHKTELIGGGANALDNVDGAVLSGNDFAFVQLPGNIQYSYILDATSGAAEVAPFVISPDANAGTKRWLLLTPYIVYPDATLADQGAASGDGYRSVKDLIDAAGARQITMKFVNSGAGSTTTFTFDTTEVFPTTCSVIVEQGAILTDTSDESITFNGSFSAGPYKCFNWTGTGNPIFENVNEVCVQWFVTSGTGTSADPWIVDPQKAVDASGGFEKSKGIVYESGYYEMSSEVEFSSTTNGMPNMRARIPRRTYITLATGSDCTMFKQSYSIGGTPTPHHPWKISGIIFRGNKDNNTGGNPIMQIENSYNCIIEDCYFYQADGVGLKIYQHETSRGSITLRDNNYVGNGTHGIHVFADATFQLHSLLIQGQGMVEANEGWGIYIDASGSSKLHQNIDICDIAFEGNYLGDVYVNSGKGISIHNNNHTNSAYDVDIIKITGDSYGCTVFANYFAFRLDVSDEAHCIYFDKETHDNYHWANNLDVFPYSQGDGTAKIYDAGNNFCLDPGSSLVRSPHALPHNNDRKAIALTGETFPGTVVNNLSNLLLHSEDLTNAAWIKAGAPTVTQDTSYAVPTGGPKVHSKFDAANYNNDYIYQDITVNAKDGELLTFSIFVFAYETTSTSSNVKLTIDDGGNANFESSGWHDAKFINVLSSSDHPWIRVSQSVVATQDAATIRCRLDFRTNSPVYLWGAQLNKGHLAPYIKTEASAVALYPGFKTHHVYAEGGSSLGYYDKGSVSGAVWLKSYYGKYQELTLTDDITTLTLYASNVAGNELVVKITNVAGGDKDISAWAANVKLIGGAYQLTQAASAVDILSFFYDGTNWWETSRAQDVK